MLTCPNCRSTNADTARFCSNCGSPLAPARPIEGERKFATVLFADVARSTAIAEKMDPEDWASIMNGAFGFMNAGIAKYGGTVSRLMGDAVLALFGAPVAHEDDAERAVRAGLEIQAGAKAYAQTVKQRYGVDFDLRVGINTGTAVLAFVGDAIRSEYTAMGDAANVAARLQSAAEPGTVLISADTHRLVHAFFDFRPRGLIEMKGKQAPVESFEVAGVKAVPGRARGLDGLASPLVGRAREIDLLGDKLAALTKGLGAVIAITGEAGLGKSRLVAELRNSRDALSRGQPVWLEARGISYGQSIPYYPWRQLGRQMIGATEMDAADAVRAKLRDYVERYGLATNDLPYYETILAVDTEASRAALADQSGEVVIAGAANAVVNALKAVMRSSDGPVPLVIVMDDLHWSDNATLELIAQVAALARSLPLLMLCVLRPDRKAPSWPLVDRLEASLGESFARIDLEPLNAADSRELLGNLLHIEHLPETIRSQILERSEGNPFYLEEVLRSLIDAGHVVREDGHWRATRDIVDAKIPETLAGVLSARIDRLPDTTKRVAQTAAVIGRVFMHRVLETVCRAAPAAERVEHVEPHIATLSYEQLVRERARDPDREYIFKHALTCEAAYGLLLKARRRELHARAGAALETLFAGRRDEMAAVLAYHFSEAEDADRALAYLARAAANARKVYALREELDHRELTVKILERLSDARPTEFIDAVIEWTKVRHRLNQYDGVIDRLERAIELARAAGDKQRLGMTLSWTGNIHMITGFPFRSFPYIEESRKIAEETGNEELHLLPLFASTWSLVDRDPAAGAEALKEVMELARKYRATDILGHATAYRAIALGRLGETEEARRHVEEALALAPHAGSPIKQADIHIAASMAYYELGEIAKGLDHARIGAEKAYGAKGIECACFGFYNVGRGEFEQRRLDEARSDFIRSRELADQGGIREFVPFIEADEALVEFEQGDTGALDTLREALNNAKSSHDEYGAATMSQKLASALLKLGRCSEAAELLADAIKFYRARRMRPSLAQALTLAGAAYDKSGRPDQASEARREAATLQTLVPGAAAVQG